MYVCTTRAKLVKHYKIRNVFVVQSPGEKNRYRKVITWFANRPGAWQVKGVVCQASSLDRNLVKIAVHLHSINTDVFDTLKTNQQYLGWVETNPSNILKHSYLTSIPMSSALYHQAAKWMSAGQILMSDGLVSTHFNIWTICAFTTQTSKKDRLSTACTACPGYMKQLCQWPIKTYWCYMLYQYKSKQDIPMTKSLLYLNIDTGVLNLLSVF